MRTGDKRRESVQAWKENVQAPMSLEHVSSPQGYRQSWQIGYCIASTAEAFRSMQCSFHGGSPSGTPKFPRTPRLSRRIRRMLNTLALPCKQLQRYHSRIWVRASPSMSQLRDSLLTARRSAAIAHEDEPRNSLRYSSLIGTNCERWSIKATTNAC